MTEIEAEAGVWAGPAAVLDAVDVVGEVEAKRSPADVLLPGLLPAEGALLVAGKPLLSIRTLHLDKSKCAPRPRTVFLFIFSILCPIPSYSKSGSVRKGLKIG
jgi:hypothetical protein